VKTWPIYLRLQTDHAYAEGMPQADLARSAGEYIERVGRDRPISGSLVIGPGGPDEVRALRGRVAGNLHVLTAYDVEAGVIRSANVPDVHVDVGDIHNMPFQHEVFSFVHASNVLEHSLAPYIALMECRRVLKPGGIASFVLPSFEGREGGRGPFHLHCLTREVWSELLHKTGLEIADVYEEPGAEDPTAHYTHFRCVALAPPHPHELVLAEVTAFKAMQEPR
jgi:SAM-dependent methyltransferase